MAPRAVCQDSEDEDDEVIYVPSQSEQSAFSWPTKQADAGFADAEPSLNLDSINDARPSSTSSSDLLGQIHHAQRGLFATVATASPAAHTNQRRRTIVVGDDSNISPAKNFNRAKTTPLKTYGSRSSATTLQTKDNEDFATFREDVAATESAQSEVQTGHLENIYLSNGRPTVRQDFMDHESNVVFRDTGETNAFNESSQQRVIEQARNGALQPEFGTTFSAQAATSEKDESSSFPWSTSVGPTQSPKSNQSKRRQYGGSPHMQQPILSDECHEIPVGEQQHETQHRVLQDLVETNVRADQRNNQDDIFQVHKTSKSSPVVEIPRYESTIDVSFKNRPSTIQKAARGRKRKSWEAKGDEEPVNYDDQHISLPKEQYKPRPSRRRATEMAEQPIDYSVVPEQAARKRRKTVDTALAVESLSDISKADSPLSNEPNLSKTEPAVNKVGRLPAEVTSPTKPGKSSETSDESENLDTEVPPPREHTMSPPSTKKLPSNAKAMAPPPLLPPSSKKGRRSKTTIFEDHVPSPTLSQQQAMRKAALEEIPVHSSHGNRRQRRTVVPENDDEEDELAGPGLQAEDPAPQKRSGVANATKKAKPTQRAIEDSEEEEDPPEQRQEEIEPPPKKPGRGRPRKAKPKEHHNPAEPTGALPIPQNHATSIPSSETAAVEQRQSSPSRAALPHGDPNRPPDIPEPTGKTTPPVHETPSPQKAAPKPSPTSHSPLKSSSLVPLRVGLSKNRKIPSLLKSFRPPPKQSTR